MWKGMETRLERRRKYMETVHKEPGGGRGGHGWWLTQAGQEPPRLQATHSACCQWRGAWTWVKVQTLPRGLHHQLHPHWN